MGMPGCSGFRGDDEDGVARLPGGVEGDGVVVIGEAAQLVAVDEEMEFPADLGGVRAEPCGKWGLAGGVVRIKD